jgi:hypothetical protein
MTWEDAYSLYSSHDSGSCPGGCGSDAPPKNPHYFQVVPRYRR